MTLERRHLSLCLVLLLTLFAGCSGIFGSGDGLGTGPTETPADQNGPAPGTTGFDATAIENGHFQTLSDESFTTSLSFQLSTEREGESKSVFVNRTVAIDRENERARSTAELVQASGETLTTTTYTADGRTAERRTLSGGSTDLTDYRSASTPYDGEVQPVNESEVIDRDFVQAIGSDIEWTYAGSESLAGDSVSRFEASGTNVTGFSADDAVSTNVSENGTAATVEAVVTVDERGVIREFSYMMTTERDGRPITVRLTVSVTEIGETSVSEPNWLSSATA